MEGTNKKRNWIKLAVFPFLLFSLLFICSCGPNLEGETRKILQEKYGMSEKEAKVGGAYAVLFHSAEKDDYGNLILDKSADGKTYYRLDYSAVSNADKIKILRQSKEDIEGILKGELNGKPLSADFIRLVAYSPELRARLQRQKQIYGWLLNRYERIEKYREFRALLGYKEERDEEDKKLTDSAYVSCPLVNIEKDTIFKPDYVQMAEKSGQKEKLESFIVQWSVEKEIDNPDYPLKEFVQKKIWKKEQVNLVFLTYDVNNDKKPDYVEVFRLNKKGEPEACPLISVFHPNGNNNLSIALVDSGKPDGVPDKFETVAIAKGSDLLVSYKALLEAAIEPDRKVKDFAYLERNNAPDVCLVNPGQVEMAGEQVNANGWNMPNTIIYQIKDKKGVFRNFEILVKYYKTNHGAANGFHKVEWLVLRYHSEAGKFADISGRVVEYYLPRQVYAEMEIRKIKVADDHTLLIYPRHGPVVTLMVENFIEEKPFKIEYDLGKERISLEDKDRDGKFESKVSRAKPDKIEIPNDADGNGGEF